MNDFEGINQDKLETPSSEGEISRRELLKRLSPLGKVKLETTQCTGCGLCALECPTGALAVSSSGADTFQVLFKHGACVACNLCVEVCPEKCLHLERALDLGKIDNAAAMLFEDSIFRCRECGSIIGSAAMIKGLRAKLKSAGSPLTSQLELCPKCKMKHLTKEVSRR